MPEGLAISYDGTRVVEHAGPRHAQVDITCGLVDMLRATMCDCSGARKVLGGLLVPAELGQEIAANREQASARL